MNYVPFHEWTLFDNKDTYIVTIATHRKLDIDRTKLVASWKSTDPEWKATGAICFVCTQLPAQHRARRSTFYQSSYTLYLYSIAICWLFPMLSFIPAQLKSRWLVRCTILFCCRLPTCRRVFCTATTSTTQFPLVSSGVHAIFMYSALSWSCFTVGSLS